MYMCSRSSTGVGEFFFKSDRSVEITHAIETVVGAMAKDKRSARTNKVSLYMSVYTLHMYLGACLN